MESETISKNGENLKSLGNFFLTYCLLATSVFLFAGCAEEVPEDPEGTREISLFKTGGREYVVWEDYGVLGIQIDDENNLSAGYLHYLYGDVRCKIARIGSVKGIGDITKVAPASDFVYQVAAQPGNGYLVSFGGNNTYVRIYVLKWIEDSSGGIISVRIKSHYPFVPK